MVAHAWFPGRYIGGAALIVAPIAWCIGLLLRSVVHRTGFTAAELEHFDRQPFAAPGQLAAYAENPALVTAGYAFFLAGAILLWPAFSTVATVVAARSPRLATLGGALLVLSLFARVYTAGVEQTAFELVELQGLDAATRAVSDGYVDISYGPWRIPVIASACGYLGMLLLVIGAFRSGTLGLGRSAVLLWAGTMWGGVLKEATLFDVLAATALGTALVPLGVRVLRGRVPELLPAETTPAPPRRPRWFSW